MRNRQKITRVQLSISPQEEASVFGIVSSDADYKLSLALNKKFRIALKNAAPLKITDNIRQEITFSRFSDISISDITYNLISNRSGKEYFIQKLKNIDYIFQVLNAENEIDVNTITANLREIESINAVFSIDINTFRDKNLHYLIQ